MTSFEVDLFNNRTIIIKVSDCLTKDKQTNTFNCSGSVEVAIKSCGVSSYKFLRSKSIIVTTKIAIETSNSITFNLSYCKPRGSCRTNQNIANIGEDTADICKFKISQRLLIKCNCNITNACRRLRRFSKYQEVINDVKCSSRSLNNTIQDNH